MKEDLVEPYRGTLVYGAGYVEDAPLVQYILQSMKMDAYDLSAKISSSRKCSPRAD